MNIITYAGMTYLMTAVIAYAVIGVIVLISRSLGRKSDSE